MAHGTRDHATANVARPGNGLPNGRSKRPICPLALSHCGLRLAGIRDNHGGEAEQLLRHASRAPRFDGGPLQYPTAKAVT